MNHSAGGSSHHSQRSVDYNDLIVGRSSFDDEVIHPVKNFPGDRKREPATDKSLYDAYRSRPASPGNGAYDCYGESPYQESPYKQHLERIARKQDRSPAKPTGVKYIEVQPGLHLRLRGASETYNAIARDFYMPGCCFACDQTIFCIADADFVLCPECRVVNPMEHQSSNQSGGVGLGFTFEQLQEWQAEIVEGQNRKPAPAYSSKNHQY